MNKSVNKFNLNDMVYLSEGKYSKVYLWEKDKVVKVIKDKYIKDNKFNKLNEEISFYKKMENIDFVPKMFDYGIDYIVLEYIKGDTLLNLLFKKQKIPREYLSKINNLLEMLYEIDIYHNDVHFENIILSGDKLYLIDFGNANIYKDNKKWIFIKKIFPLYSYIIYPLRFILLNRYSKVIYLFIKHKIVNSIFKLI